MRGLTISRRVMSSDRQGFQFGKASQERRATFGSLVLDKRGVVVCCSDSGGRIFGGESGDLEGSAIGALIASITFGTSLTRFSMRYTADLCRTGNWRCSQAVDVYGKRFAVEILLSRMMVDDDEMYLLNLRQPAEG